MRYAFTGWKKKIQNKLLHCDLHEHWFGHHLFLVEHYSMVEQASKMAQPGIKYNINKFGIKRCRILSSFRWEKKSCFISFWEKKSYSYLSKVQYFWHKSKVFIKTKDKTLQSNAVSSILFLVYIARFIDLTHQVSVLPSCRNQPIDLHSNSAIDWFLYEGNTGT